MSGNVYSFLQYKHNKKVVPYIKPRPITMGGDELAYMLRLAHQIGPLEGDRDKPLHQGRFARLEITFPLLALILRILHIRFCNSRLGRHLHRLLEYRHRCKFFLHSIA